MDIDNKQLIDAVLSAPNGEIKSASAAGSSAIRLRLREQGFARKIFNVVPVTHDDMDRSSMHDHPVIIDELEPESPGAWNITFDGSTETHYFDGPRFESKFYDITTPEFTKNVDTLATYKQDLKKVITDNALLSIQDREDVNFIADVDKICGSANSINAFTGLVHHHELAGKMGRLNLVDIKSILEKISLPTGTILMNRITGNELLKEGRDTVGGDFSQEMYLGGRKVLEEREILGMRCLFTLKRDLIPDNVVYVFAPHEYMGKFYELHKPTMYVEKKIKTLRFQARSTIAMTIANLNSVHKVTLTAGS